MRKSAIIIGLIMLGIGAFIILIGTPTLSNYFKGNFGTTIGVYYAGYFLSLIGAVILVAHFKGWLERSAGTRW
jgi:hypothetical protein